MIEIVPQPVGAPRAAATRVPGGGEDGRPSFGAVLARTDPTSTDTATPVAAPETDANAGGQQAPAEPAAVPARLAGTIAVEDVQVGLRGDAASRMLAGAAVNGPEPLPESGEQTLADVARVPAPVDEPAEAPGQVPASAAGAATGPVASAGTAPPHVAVPVAHPSDLPPNAEQEPAPEPGIEADGSGLGEKVGGKSRTGGKKQEALAAAQLPVPASTSNVPAFVETPVAAVRSVTGERHPEADNDPEDTLPVRAATGQKADAARSPTPEFTAAHNVHSPVSGAAPEAAFSPDNLMGTVTAKPVEGPSAGPAGDAAAPGSSLAGNGRDGTIAGRPGMAGHALGLVIMRAQREGRDILSVQLDPAELGRVEVRLAFGERGDVSAVISAEQPGALALLRRDTADLVRALNQGGLSADAGGFRFEQRGQGQDRPANRNPRTPIFQAPEPVAALVPLAGNRLDLLA